LLHTISKEAKPTIAMTTKHSAYFICFVIVVDTRDIAFTAIKGAYCKHLSANGALPILRIQLLQKFLIFNSVLGSNS